MFNNNVEILLQFERQSQKYFEFYLSINNHSDSAFIFNPKYIYSQSVQGDNESFDRKYFAIDPEKHLDQIDHEINQTEANKKALS